MDRKKIFICVLVTLLLCGCSASNISKSDNQLIYDIEQIGSYENMTADKIKIEVTNEEIQAEMQANLMPYSKTSEVKGRGVKKGDIVYLSYSATDDEGLTEETECEIIVGDNDFDMRFEEELIGKEAKKQYSFFIQYDNECNYGNWKNKKIKFEVNIERIEETVFPELTKAFLKKNFKMNTIEEYIQYIEKIVYDIKFEQNKKEITKRAMTEIIGNTTFGDSYNDRCETRINEVLESYQKYADLLGISLSDVLSGFNMTEKDIRDSAKYNEACAQICQYIIDKEELMPSDKEMEEMKQSYVEEYGYESIDDFIIDNGEQYLNECIYNIIGLDYIYENMNFN